MNGVRRLVLAGTHCDELEEPRAGEVLVRIVASGTCHTDLHARDVYFPNLPYPVVCGHEGAGMVEEVGAAVTGLAAGTTTCRVGTDPSRPSYLFEIHVAARKR